MTSRFGTKKLRSILHEYGRAGMNIEDKSHTLKVTLSPWLLAKASVILPVSFSLSGTRRLSQFIYVSLNSDVSVNIMVNTFEKHGITDVYECQCHQWKLSLGTSRGHHHVYICCPTFFSCLQSPSERLGMWLCGRVLA